MKQRHKIQFPLSDSRGLAQDDAYFFLVDGSGQEQIRLHDYARIYEVPNLYEQVVYERLKCQSHIRVSEVLEYTVRQSDQRLSALRVLDLGAGNGMVGEELTRRGVARMVGVDIIPEAQTAAERDRPGVYDAFYTADFTALPPDVEDDLRAWSFDCLVSVAALGFGDIPVAAFLAAFNIIRADGWVAFNIKDSFLDRNDESGFSTLIRELIFSKYLDLYHLQRYQHRLSIDGEPIYYFALGGRKNADVPADFVASLRA